MDAADTVKPWVGDLKPYTPGETHDGCVKLASNENNYGPSPKVVERLREAAPQVYKYPFKDKLLREAIANYAGVAPENIICGNGSDEIIELVLKAFEGPSAGVLPSFSEYKIISKTLGVEYIETPLNPDFTLDTDAFLKNSAKANLLFLDNPCNPTGGVIPRDDLVKILEAGKITVIDEAYFEYYGETLAGKLEKFKNLIILRTFSKAFGLGGLRVGYAIAGEEVIKFLDKVHPPFNVNSLAQEAALAALDDIEYMKEVVKKTVADREMLAEKLGSRFKVFPSQTNFILLDVSPSTAEEFFKQMLGANIVVRKFGEFPGFEGEYARITVGTSEENQELLAALELSTL